MPKEHVLLGLEPDNLLAFLALLGFHRCLEHTVPDWQTRVFWSGPPLRPRVLLSKAVDRASLLEMAAQGAAELAHDYSFGRPNLDYSAEQARQQLKQACEAPDRRGIDLISALMSDGAVRDGKIRATPFCAMFGQGHQNFLERLEAVPKGLPPKELQNETTAQEFNSANKLEKALFEPWERRDRTQSFRWDPLEDRRYALRSEDPSTDKGLTVHGANRLACLALPLLTAVPVRERGEVRLYAINTKWQDGSLVIRWPVWSRPARLKAIVFMLAGCGVDFPFGGYSQGLSIMEVFVSERVSVGKFFNFTRAVPVAPS